MAMIMAKYRSWRGENVSNSWRISVTAAWRSSNINVAIILYLNSNGV